MSEILPVLPDFRNPDFLNELRTFGRFLENNIRPGCRFDLSIYPNALWQLIETKMLKGLNDFLSTEVSDDQVLMLQWYNSGVFIRCNGKIAGFDILPIPRFYGWPEPSGLTEKIAGMLDCLMVTHDHADHYDEKLVNACRQKGVPVLMHPLAAADSQSPVRMHDGEEVTLQGILIRAMHAKHVWRNHVSDVPLAMFEVEFPSAFRMVFCGDGDYTDGFNMCGKKPDLLFITWRNPGPEFEDGHPAQKYKTIDAVDMAIKEICPKRIILQHYAELDHVYKGFSASYDMAADLVHKLSVKTTVNFWGDVVKLS